MSDGGAACGVCGEAGLKPLPAIMGDNAWGPCNADIKSVPLPVDWPSRPAREGQEVPASVARDQRHIIGRDSVCSR
jgi:hypothetical protein